MKALKLGALAALVLVCATAVVAAPAYATPANTTTVVTAAPFFTPLGNTRGSGSTFASPRVDFTVGGFTVTCRAGASAYVPMTHTALVITDARFNGCVPNVGIAATVTTTATSVTPFGLHLTSTVAGAPASWNTTLVVPGGQRISVVITLGGGRFCGYTAGPQSIKAIDTDARRTLFVNGLGVAVVLDAGSDPVCPPGPMTIIGNYNFRSDTPADNFRSTLNSNGN